MANDLVAQLVTELKLETTTFKSQMSQAFTDAVQKSRQMADSINANTASIKQAASSIFSNFRTSASNAFKAVGQDFAVLAKTLSKGLLVGSLAAPGILGYGIKTSSKAIDDLGDSATKLGLSVRDIEQFKYAMAAAGGDTSHAVGILDQANTRVGEFSLGVGRAAKVFRAAGIDIDQFRGQNAIEALQTLDQVTEKLSKPERAKVFTAFADGLYDVNDLLNKSNGSLKEFMTQAQGLGIGLSTSQQQGAEAFNASINKLFTLWDSFKLQTMANLARPLSNAIDAILNKIKEAGGIKQATTNIAKYILDGIKSFAELVKDLIAEMKGLMDWISKTVNHPYKTAGKAALEAIDPTRLFGVSNGLISKAFDDSGTANSNSSSGSGFINDLERQISNLSKSALPDFDTTLDGAVQSVQRAGEAYKEVANGAYKVANTWKDTIGATLTTGFNYLTKAVSDTAKNISDIGKKMREDASSLLNPNSSLSDIANESKGKIQVQDEGFKNDVQDFLRDVKDGQLSPGQIKSNLDTLQMSAENVGTDDKYENGKWNSYTNSGLLGAVEELRKRFEQPIKNVIEVQINASSEFDAKVNKISENAFTQILTKEATGVNR